MEEVKVLVVYDTFPEETHKAIVTMTAEEYNIFKLANNTYINGDDMSEEVDNINNTISYAFCKEPSYEEYAETILQKKYFGKWVEFLSEDITDLREVDYMICCGINV
tara:strand:- start:371 stop:691 length:321 start_codon:yes stop_codon:yes gene_type:complete